MNALVQFALARQPLPETALALERPEFGISVAPTGLSPMLAGCSVYDYATHLPDDSAASHLTERGVEGDMNTPEAVQNTTAVSSKEAVVTNADPSMRKETMLVVHDGSLDNIDFDERLSQQI
jgi:hypothetical protein